ncbi:MAG: TROVE domain-containing protein [Acidimicrobiales bacterium]|nr:TROVE domain-containing protein [Acidimicrobiales bacterium]
MKFKYARHLSNQMATPQNEPIPGREAEMSLNAAGGVVFDISDWDRFHRFLVLGSEGGTYYSGEHELTVANASVVERCLLADGERVVNEIVTVSEAGRAPKNDSAILALAIACKRGDDVTRKMAFSALNRVCRTGTHLFQFAEYIEALGGWGRGARRAVGSWYVDKDPELLAYQVVKYRQRGGWTHADLLRLSHPRPLGPLSDVMAFAAGKPTGNPLPAIAEGYIKASLAPTAEKSASLIADYDLPRECIRSEHLSEPIVLEALLDKMPMTAMIRNLGTMTVAGVITPFSNATQRVLQNIGDNERLKKARIHPMALFLALTTYAAGHGARGRGIWTPVQQVVDALDAAFYESLSYVVPTNRRMLLAVDVSGSMLQLVGGTTVSAATVGAAMALIVAKTEPNYFILGVNTAPVELRVSPKMRLDAASAVVQRSISGGTDLSVPARWLTSECLDIDAVITMTDSETWAGQIQPSQALEAYRKSVEHEVRNVVASVTATGHSIGDSADPNTLQCVGLDSALPEIIRSFVAGEL